jgi:hypothetical protein
MEQSIPVFLLGPTSGIAFGMWIFWMIATGKLVTRREADALVATIESQRKTIHSQNDQMHLVLKETAPTLNEFLADLRDAVANKTEEEK